MSKYYLILSFLISSIGGSHAQTALRGTVLDAANTPISFAHLQLSEQAASTVTNEEGRFQLQLTQLPFDALLTVTAIGYQTLRVPLSEFPNLQELRLQLQDTVYALTEISVSSESPEEILKSAIRAIPDNYPNQPYSSEGFFRTAYAENGRYVKLLETAVEIADRNFVADKPIKGALLHIRKSDDFSTLVGYENTNWLYTIAEESVLVRNRATVLDLNQLDQLDISLHERSFLDGALLNVLNATLQTSKLDVRYRLYILDASRAIVRIDQEIQFLEPQLQGGYDNIPNSEYLAKRYAGSEYYTVLEDRYYLKHCWYEAEFHLRDKATKKAIGDLSILGEYLVHQNEVKNPTTIRKNLGRNADLYHVDRPFDPVFWASYTQPVDTDLFRRIRADLEAKTPLEEQYQRNGARDTRRSP